MNAYLLVNYIYLDNEERFNFLNNTKRGAFYQILEYKYVEDADDSKTWSRNTAPIVYVLYASKAADLLHCLKLSYINPLKIKTLFKI